VTLASFCVRPQVSESRKQRGVANLDRVVVSPRLVSAVLTLSLPQNVARDDPAPVLPQQYACVCVCMNVFKRNKFLVKVGLGSILIKRLGHPMN